MQRRDFLKLSATAGAVAAVTGCSKDLQTIEPDAQVEPEQLNYSACLGNCGNYCPFEVYSRNGVITRIEGARRGDDVYGTHQMRPCLKGASLRQMTYSPERIPGPMKRVPGTKRGEGQWQLISWDQAFSEIANKVDELRAEYGPRSIFLQHGLGAFYALAGENAIRRVLNVSGGYMNYHGTYSRNQLMVAGPATYGGSGSPYPLLDGNAGTHISELKYSDLFVGFGFNPFEMAMSGGGEQYDFLNAVKNSRANGGLDVVMVDPRYTDSTLGKEDDWLPIRPGTDGALAEAIAYEMISSGWVANNSKEFLDKHCVGYDRASLEKLQQEKPELAKYINPDENYHDYIMGVGIYSLKRDAVWGAKRTSIPKERILDLAHKIMDSSAPYIVIGKGCNRHACGEQTMRSLYMLPILTGKIGQRGVNNGEMPLWQPIAPAMLSPGKYPEPAQLPAHSWTEAIVRGEDMDGIRDGIKGLKQGEKLGTNIKAVFCIASNNLINQHSDINNSRAIVEDESKCELIVVSDTVMSTSAQMADYILPDSTWLESEDMSLAALFGEYTGVNFMSSSLKPVHDCRSLYQIGLGLAKAFGCEQEYSEGRTEAEWLEYLYQKNRSMYPFLKLPETFKDAQKIGYVHQYRGAPHTAMSSFVNDGKPVNTPSGKIEIYSVDWAKKRAEWIPRSNEPYDQITPLPQYTYEWEGYEDEKTRNEYPLQLVGYHTKARVHSTMHDLPWLREAIEDAAWINPLDAAKFGVNNGSDIILTSLRGSIKTRAKVTPRVAAGVVALGQGAWYKATAVGELDTGGSVNTLTKYHPTPVSKGNPQHTVRVRIDV